MSWYDDDRMAEEAEPPIMDPKCDVCGDPIEDDVYSRVLQACELELDSGDVILVCSKECADQAVKGAEE